MRRGIAVIMLIGGLSPAAVASPGNGASADGPRRTTERFDSLMLAGTPESFAAARALTTGPARRFFPLLAEAQSRFLPFLDTARSRDSVLREEARGDWSVLEIRSEMVFRKSFLGMERMAATQAVHLHRGASGWRIADFEELAEGARATPRSGPLADSGEEDAGSVGRAGGTALLPVSPLAPAEPSRVTRLRLRVATRGGDSLRLPASTPGQRVLARDVSWAEIETRVPEVRGAALSWHDSLAPYRASTPELDLTDKMLRTLAARLREGAKDDAEIARRVRRHVSENFEYRLGATLFATSREALRDGKGDCSEAAVLSAALLRAAGVPSRLALGYATLGRGVWIGHAWAEAFIGGEWIGVDAALREFPAGANRVALLTLSGERPLKPDATNLMMRTLSNLDIEILEAWAGERALPLVAHPGAEAEAQEFWDKLLEGIGR